MACQSSLNRPQDRQTRRCLDQRDGSQALGHVGIRNRCHHAMANREFKKQRQLRSATKTSLKKWIGAASNFIALIPSRLICQMLEIFLELSSKQLYQSSRKEKESCCLVFPCSTKREIRHFHVVVVQRRLITRADKGWAVKRARPSKKVWFSGLGLCLAMSPVFDFGQGLWFVL